jgi:plastocyanin
LTKFVVRPTALMTFLAVAACGGPTGSVQGASTGPQIEIPKADRFQPFITATRVGQTITIHNADSDTHTVTSIPGGPVTFDLEVPGGASRTLVISPAGNYVFYCKIHAHFDPTTGQVAANAGADHPDEPMEGVLAVAG